MGNKKIRQIMETILNLGQYFTLGLATFTMGYLTYKVITHGNGEVVKENSKDFTTSTKESISNISQSVLTTKREVNTELNAICKEVNHLDIKDDILTSVSIIRESINNMELTTNLNIMNITTKIKDELPSSEVINQVPLGTGLTIVALSLVTYSILQFLRNK